MASVRIEQQAVVTIASGGTALPLASSSIPVASIVIQAEYTNVGRISIGNSSVSSNTGIEIGPGDTFTLSVETLHKVGEFDLKDIYVVSGTAGDKVRILAFRRN
jgi:hypothetical protein